MIRRSIAVPLAILLSLLLMQAQTFALGAGVPWNGTDSDASFLGTYSGVMLPSADTTYDLEGKEFDPFEPVDPADFVDSNALGLFLLAVGENGVANGQILLFLDVDTFVGNITGLADNRKGQLFTVIDAVSTVGTVIIIGDDTIRLVDTAGGRLIASVFNSNSSAFGGTGFGAQSLLGVSQVTRFDSIADTFTTINFQVDGLLQSSDTTVPDFEDNFEGAADQ